MNLTGFTDKIEVVTSSSAPVEVQASWNVLQGGRIQEQKRSFLAIVSATTSDLVSTSQLESSLEVTSIQALNSHATDPNEVSFLRTDGTTSILLWNGTLSAKESVTYSGGSFSKFTSSGVPALYTNVGTATVLLNPRLINGTSFDGSAAINVHGLNPLAPATGESLPASFCGIRIRSYRITSGAILTLNSGSRLRIL